MPSWPTRHRVGLFFLVPNKYDCASQRMWPTASSFLAALCCLWLQILPFSSLGHRMPEPAKYHYGQSQIFVFTCFYATKTEIYTVIGGFLAVECWLVSKRNFTIKESQKEKVGEIKATEESIKRELLVYYSKLEFLKVPMLTNSPAFQIKRNQDKNQNKESKDKRHQRREVECTQEGYPTASDMVDQSKFNELKKI